MRLTLKLIYFGEMPIMHSGQREMSRLVITTGVLLGAKAKSFLATDTQINIVSSGILK